MTLALPTQRPLRFFYFALRLAVRLSGALVVVAHKAGLDEGTRQLYEREVSLEVPFNSSRKMAASVHRLPSSGDFAGLNLNRSDLQFSHVAVVKGAPDRVSGNFRILE